VAFIIGGTASLVLRARRRRALTGQPASGAGNDAERGGKAAGNVTF